MINNGSSVDVFLYDTFVQMGLSGHRLRNSLIPITGFGRNQVGVEGETILPVTFGSEPHQRTLPINFIVARTSSAYNAILGHPTLNKFRAIVSTYHLLVRFPTRTGIGEARGDQSVAHQCLTIQDKQLAKSLTLDQLDPRDESEDSG